MQTRILGNSDLQISRIGFGAWAAGGPWQYGWSAQDDAASIAAIHRALELGVNWIDTAAIYGLGHSEEVLAKALAEWPGARPLVFTKCGMIWDEQGTVGYSTKAASIRREVEASLRRLKLEVIDLYQMHWPADELEETLEGCAELARLKEEGKIRWIGVSNFSREELAAACPVAPISSLQPPYSLVQREIEEGPGVLPFCLEKQIGVIVYSPMTSGLLTGSFTRDRAANLPEDDWRRKSENFHEPKLSRNLAIAERLRWVGAQHGRTAGEVAIAWTLLHPAVTGAIVGARSAAQVNGVFRAAEMQLSSAEVAEIEK